ncbi:DUF1430 domain-containing protein [Streptococcus sciuri]|uniref:DUF1430 domain-containing protein n=1 Tax=Streptococcus sciuri TaxID=2973939 RepID=A0ABT2F8G1_9STRE|nr:DUF1430 domain-containing protein [Streptococcus sciuri]MCS4488704.1 DUF1430 domain-containing protein [Streptococcus sciuri]
MKRVFIVLSTLIVSLFLTEMILVNSSIVHFISYPSATVVGSNIAGKKVANRKELTSALTKLADNKESVIARRIVEPNQKGKTDFTYQFYGKGKRPRKLTVANAKSASESDLVNSYLIIGGRLSSKELAQKFMSLGYSAVADTKTPLLMILASVALNQVSLITVLIFVITFFSIAVTTKIKDMRSVSVRLISGESSYRIFKRLCYQDGLTLLTSALLSIGIGCSILLGFGELYSTQALLVLVGTLFYILILMSMSILLAGVYILAVKEVHLCDLLKGKLPLKNVFFLLIVCQIATIVTVGWAIQEGKAAYDNHLVLKKGENDWTRHKSEVQPRLNFGAGLETQEKMQESDKKWYQMSEEAVASHQAIAVDFTSANSVESRNFQSLLLDNHPILYVTPDYFKKGNVHLSKETKDYITHFSTGEYALVFPKSLKGQEAAYQKKASQLLDDLSHETEDITSPKVFDLKEPRVDYIKDRDCFLYNAFLRATQKQLVISPVFVVVTPKSTGTTPNSYQYWAGVAVNSMHFNSYDKLVKLLKNKDLYSSVSYITNDRLQFLQQVHDEDVRLLTMIVGVFLSVGTSILLFDVMNLVYFEQFRRDIFIKRLAGMRFLELHKTYILIQFASLVIAIGPVFYLTRLVGIVSFVGLIFLGNLLATLGYQASRENAKSVSILKGK